MTIEQIIQQICDTEPTHAGIVDIAKLVVGELHELYKQTDELRLQVDIAVLEAKTNADLAALWKACAEDLAR